MIDYIGIAGRNDIPRFLNEEGYSGYGVEIGTHRGIFAETLISVWDGTLICVDPWNLAEDYDDQIPLLTGGTDRDSHELEARTRLMPFVESGKCKILKTTSKQALSYLPNNTLDFVYVDGNHKYRYVLEDMTNWWNKIKPGGFLFGHDYIYPGEFSWAHQVQPAVNDFCKGHQVNHCIIPDGTDPWSFAIRKPA